MLYSETMTRSLAILLWLGLASPAVADDGQQREANRIAHEMTSLATRNAWDGVERHYEEIVTLDATLPSSVYHLAGEAARNRGDVHGAIQRFEAALTAGHGAETESTIKVLRDEFGRAEIIIKPGSHDLVPDATPFRPDHVVAIEFARAILADRGHFSGYLPAGRYTVGDHAFEVRPHVSPRAVDLRGNGSIDPLAVVDHAPKIKARGGGKLALRGAALQKQGYVEVLVVSLHAGKKLELSERAPAMSEPWRLTLHAAFRSVPHQELAQVFRAQLTDPSHKESVQRLTSMLGSLQRGDVLVIEWSPEDSSVHIEHRGRYKGAVKGVAFSQALWRMYVADGVLGPRLRGEV